MDFEIYANATHLFAHRGPRVRVSQRYHTQTLRGRYLTRAHKAIINRIYACTVMRNRRDRLLRTVPPEEAIALIRFKDKVDGNVRKIYRRSKRRELKDESGVRATDRK